MVTREDIVVEVQKLPEEYLSELYQIIKTFEQRTERSRADQNVMVALRSIKISASPDLSTKSNLYDLDEKDAH